MVFESPGTGVIYQVKAISHAPALTTIANPAVNEGQSLHLAVTATDPDPGQTLTYSLAGAPAGASIDPATGLLSWMPSEADGPGVFTFTVRVTDDGSPSLFAEEPITVTVNEVNVAPVLNPIGNKSVDEGSLLSFTAVASDTDLPANALTFSLVAGAGPGGTPVPAGASDRPDDRRVHLDAGKRTGHRTHHRACDR